MQLQVHGLHGRRPSTPSFFRYSPPEWHILTHQECSCAIGRDRPPGVQLWFYTSHLTSPLGIHKTPGTHKFQVGIL